MLGEAIAALPPVFREVIMLREIEELSYRDIADITGAPVGTVMGAQERSKIEIVPLIAHASTVNAAAFSRDGTHVLTGSQDGTLKLWDIATARLVRTFAGHKGEITAVALSPDGTLALSGSEDKTMRLWKLATGRLIRTIYAHLDATGCVSAWNKDPVFGVIGIQSGPR